MSTSSRRLAGDRRSNDCETSLWAKLMANRLNEPLSRVRALRARQQARYTTTVEVGDWFLSSRLGASDLAQELADLALHQGRPFGELGHGVEHGLGRAAGLGRRLGHVRDAGAHRLRAARRALDVARDLARGRALLLDRGRDRGGNLVDLADNAGDALDRRDGGLGFSLD